MWTRMAVVLGLAAVAAALPTACSIENCEEGAYCPGDGHGSAERECRATCGRLAKCGRIDESERWACMEACLDSLWEDEDRAEDYGECVEEASSCFEVNRCGRPPFDLTPSACAEDEEPNSDGACVPVPAVDAGSAPGEDAGGEATRDAGMTADAAPQQDAGTADASPSSDASPSADASTSPDAEPTSDTSADAAPCPCVIDEDCPSGSACRDGLCRAQCTVSCECSQGEVCRDGLCVPAEPACSSESDADAQSACGVPSCTAPL